MHFKAVGADTQGAFSLMERSLPTGGAPPPTHRHPGAEGFFVLEGTVTFTVEGEDTAASDGTFVLVPKGDAHTFANRSDAVARLLILHAPAADAYFADLDKLWSAEGGAPDREQERELQRRHGWDPA